MQLIEVDNNNDELRTICTLYDNGDLSIGDEISGDNIFSSIEEFTLSSSIKLRVKAKSLETEGEVEGFSSTVVLRAFQPISSASKIQVTNTLDNTYGKLNEIINNDFNTTLVKTVEWLNSFPYVQDAKIVDGSIEIKFTSGLSSGIIISTVNNTGSMTSGGTIQRSDGVLLIFHFS